MDAKSAKKNGDGKKVNRDDRQSGVKVEELAEKLLKSFGIAANPEDKIFALAKSQVELERENSRRGSILKLSEKALEKEQREKEHLQKEYNKGVLIRDKLEQVCREQQKLMKSIKSESMTKIRDEEEKRKETQAHFQQSINEIFSTLGKNNDENLKIKEANLEMTKKFKFLAEQYELREKQLEKLNEQIKLESQLNDAKLAKIQMEAIIEREVLLKEKQSALEEIIETNKTVLEMQAREKTLKEQLNLYTNKYEEFQSSLKSSSNIFSTYKVEIEKMAKRIKTLEKDCYNYRIKYEKCNKALLDMASDRQAQDQYVGKASRQLSQLQKLCRTLQAERSVLVELLKTHNIQRPEMPELPPEPKDIEPPPKQTDKLDIMSRNCDELKRTLAQLQTQMNSMSIEKEKIEEKTSVAAASTATANKKTKNKKGKSKAESKGTAAKVAAAKDPLAASAADESNASTSNASDSIDDKPLAELVTKVLAENPPPIDFLEKVLTSEVLADILNDVPDDVVTALGEMNGAIAAKDTEPVPVEVTKDVSNLISGVETATGGFVSDVPAPGQNGDAIAEPTVTDANGDIPNGPPA